MAGTQISFSASAYASDTHTLEFAFNNGVNAPTVVEGTVDGDGFLVETTAPTAPGVYSWAEVYTVTATEAKLVGRQGTTTVTANPLVAATPTIAATILGKLQTAYSARAENSRGSVSFNGQSVSWNSPTELRNEITYWQARVLTEQREAARLRGGADPGLIRPVFLQPGNHYCQ